jgi:hypothetical protein
MLFSSWLRNRSSNKRTVSFRPRLEALDGRIVPSTLTVTNTLDDGSIGSLGYEIGAAQSGDTINFDPTVFNPSLSAQTITLGGEELLIDKSLTIQGPGAGTLTIDGGGMGYGSRVFEVRGATTSVTLSGLSLVNGNGVAVNPGSYIGFGGGSGGSSTIATDGQGGAVWNGGNLTITGCVLQGNTADIVSGSSAFPLAGGAVYNAGTLKVINSTLSYNTAGDIYTGSYGNGGAIDNAGTLTVTGSTLSNNTATGYGGAVYNAGTLSVSGGAISNNSASSEGGGVYSGYKTTASFTGCVMSGNTASGGGALWNDGTMTLSGCTVTGNTATYAGGGIDNAKDGHLTIQSGSKVTGNTASVGSDIDNLGTLKISKDSTVGVIGK